MKENIKAPSHWPLCGEFTGDRWIPRTKGQLCGKRFHLMTSSWLVKGYLGTTSSMLHVFLRQLLPDSMRVILIQKRFNICFGNLYCMIHNHQHVWFSAFILVTSSGIARRRINKMWKDILASVQENWRHWFKHWKCSVWIKLHQALTIIGAPAGIIVCYRICENPSWKPVVAQNNTANVYVSQEDIQIQPRGIHYKILINVLMASAKDIWLILISISGRQSITVGWIYRIINMQLLSHRRSVT